MIKLKRVVFDNPTIVAMARYVANHRRRDRKNREPLSDVNKIRLRISELYGSMARADLSIPILMFLAAEIAIDEGIAMEVLEAMWTRAPVIGDTLAELAVVACTPEGRDK